MRNRIRILSDIIRRLLDHRDYLCLQLGLEYGNISDEDFKSRARPYLQNMSKDSDEFDAEQLRCVLDLVPRDYDSETISVLFGCSIPQAERAILELEGERRFQ